jgi:hypothetical protein
MPIDFAPDLNPKINPITLRVIVTSLPYISYLLASFEGLTGERKIAGCQAFIYIASRYIR